MKTAFQPALRLPLRICVILGKRHIPNKVRFLCLASMESELVSSQMQRPIGQSPVDRLQMMRDWFRLVSSGHQQPVVADVTWNV